METEKLPFEITPQIERYLEDILFLVEEGPEDAYKSPLFYFVSFYKSGEKRTPKQDTNRERFWRYLEKQNAIKALRFSSKPDKELDDLLYPKNVLAKDHTFSVCKREDNAGVDSVFTSSISLFYDHAFKKGMDELGKNTGPGQIFLLKNNVLIEKLLEKIKEKTITDENNKNIEYTKPTDRDFKVRFDSQNGVVRYGDEVLKFQKGLRGERPRLLLFKKLWPEKKHIKSGVIKALGKLTPPEMLAVQLDIVSDSHTFNQNQQVKDRFFDLIKGINRALKSKNIPAKIERVNGIQLVVIEK